MNKLHLNLTEEQTEADLSWRPRWEKKKRNKEWQETVDVSQLLQISTLSMKLY